jgi:membrane fusion protein (multidrug efflux system)
VAQLVAEVERAEADGRTALRERDRTDRLFATGAVPRADYDRSVEAEAAEQARVASLRHALSGAQDRVAQRRAELSAVESHLVEVRSNGPRSLVVQRASVALRTAALDLAKAQLAQAEQNLSYARILAPISGVVAKRAVAIGDHVGPGQQLAAIAESGALWITANYRETQLQRMKPGQAATVRVDALGVAFEGTVESLGGATGARVSEIPPENATGNYVKVVQRIPVRIGLRPRQSGLDQLRIGLSAEPEVMTE